MVPQGQATIAAATVVLIAAFAAAINWKSLHFNAIALSSASRPQLIHSAPKMGPSAP